MRKRSERPVPRKMRVIRTYVDGLFHYYMIFSDGEIRLSTKQEATQWSRAYQAEIKTIVGKPTEATWNTIGS